jgi:hypothetical protein
MSTGDGTFHPAAIDAKLGEILNALPVPPPWFERWRRLGPESSDEERLAVFQAIREDKTLPEDAALHMISWQVDLITDLLRPLDERLEAIEVAHGLPEGCLWEPGEAPPEHAEILEQYHKIWDDLFAAQLEEHGKHEMAALFRNDR